MTRGYSRAPLLPSAASENDSKVYDGNGRRAPGRQRTQARLNTILLTCVATLIITVQCMFLLNPARPTSPPAPPPSQAAPAPTLAAQQADAAWTTPHRSITSKAATAPGLPALMVSTRSSKVTSGTATPSRTSFGKAAVETPRKADPLEAWRELLAPATPVPGKTAEAIPTFNGDEWREVFEAAAAADTPTATPTRRLPTTTAAPATASAAVDLRVHNVTHSWGRLPEFDDSIEILSMDVFAEPLELTELAPHRDPLAGGAPAHGHSHGHEHEVDEEEEAAALEVEKEHPSTALFPKIIHQRGFDQIWWQADNISQVPAPYDDNMGTWTSKNPDHALRLYSEASADVFVNRHFSKRVAAAYARLPLLVQRTDFLRYLVLFRYGGVYADADTRCVRPIVDWDDGREGIRLVLGKEWNWIIETVNEDTRSHMSLASWTIAAQPGHELLALAINLLVTRIEQAPEHALHQTDAIIGLGGPSFITNVLGKWMKQRGADLYDISTAGIEDDYAVGDVLVLGVTAFSPKGPSSLGEDHVDVRVQHLFAGFEDGGWRTEPMYAAGKVKAIRPLRSTSTTTEELITRTVTATATPSATTTGDGFSHFKVSAWGDEALE
ncbi:hypothetical protein HK101_010513 [Irineochytrium annulatum]|nr:hypothetical protein HK101_010513 [Irineochytrium annulatum]